MTITKSSNFRLWIDKRHAKVRGQELAGIFRLLNARDDADAVVDQALKEDWTGQKMLDYLKAGSEDIPVQKPGVAIPMPLPATVVPTFPPSEVFDAQPRRAKKTKGEKKKFNLLGFLKKKEDPVGVRAETAKKPAKGGKKWLIIGGIVLLVVAVMVAAVMFLGGGGSSYSFADPVLPPSSDGSPGGSSPSTPSTQPAVPTEEPLSQAEKNDKSFWSSWTVSEVPELSPGNMGNQLSAKTVVGLILMVVLTLWSWGEGSIRRKSQQGASYFTVLGLLAGWLTMPILVWVTKATYPGWILVGVSVVIWLWSNAASTIKSQSDMTPFLTALALFTASLFYYGKLTFIVTFGGLFGATWTAWQGVTTIAGAFTLLMTGRGIEAVLTLVILVLGLTVMVMASLEVGKKHGVWSAFFIAATIILTFGLANWGLGAGVEYLVQAQGTSVAVTVVLNVLAPILAWILSLLVSVGIGVALGDTEVGKAENRQRLGLEKTGTFMQSIADFGILGTLTPLFFGVIIILI